LYTSNKLHEFLFPKLYILRVRVQLKRDGIRWRTGGEVKWKLANGVVASTLALYLGARCIQHYYRWCPHLGCQ